MNIFKDSLKVVILSSIVSFGILFVFAETGWLEPAVSPPGGNIFNLLNTSSDTQSKSGGLILNTSGSASDGLVVDKGNVVI